MTTIKKMIHVYTCIQTKVTGIINQNFFNKKKQEKWIN